MKKHILLFLAFTFLFCGCTAEGEFLSVSKVIESPEKYQGRDIIVYGKPGCTRSVGKYYVPYHLHLEDINESSKKIFINFNEKYIDSKQLWEEKPTEFGFTENVVRVDNEENCFKVLDKIAIDKIDEKIYIKGMLTTVYPAKLPAMFLYE